MLHEHTKFNLSRLRYQSFQGKAMKRFITFAFLLMLTAVFLTGGCAVQSTNAVFPPKNNEPTKIIYLVSHGWHAGIVVKRTDITENALPKLHAFTNVEYLEIGWGDKDYYTTPNPGLSVAVKAVLLPTSSVLHLVGFHSSPEKYFPHSEIIRIELSTPGFDQMILHISKSFSHDEAGQVIPLGSGLYGNSRFYASQEIYHLCKTCNSWTAGTLQAAGCPVGSTPTVNSLMSQTRGFGKVIQAKSGHQ